MNLKGAAQVQAQSDIPGTRGGGGGGFITFLCRDRTSSERPRHFSGCLKVMGMLVCVKVGGAVM